MDYAALNAFFNYEIWTGVDVGRICLYGGFLALQYVTISTILKTRFTPEPSSEQKKPSENTLENIAEQPIKERKA